MNFEIKELRQDFDCLICSKSFKVTSSELKEHLDTHFFQCQVRPSNRDRIKIGDCIQDRKGRKFLNLGPYLVKLTEGQLKDPRNCPFCGKEVPKRRLLVHIYVQHDKFCYKCHNKSFQSVTSYKNHLKTIPHQEKMKFSCPAPRCHFSSYLRPRIFEHRLEFHINDLRNIPKTKNTEEITREGDNENAESQPQNNNSITS